MKIKIIALVTFLALVAQSNAQKISGRLSAIPNQTIQLQGFDNFNTYVIDSTQTDAMGNFSLNFKQQNYGIGLLSTKELKPAIVILTKEAVVFELIQDELEYNLQVSQGLQNMLFKRYVTEQPKREQALSAWRYLQDLYASDAFFIKSKESLKAIKKETEKVHRSEEQFLNNLAADSYLKWYIQVRKLIQSVAQVAQYRTDEIPATREALRNIDFTDQRLYKSGMLNEAIENHIWFIENSSGSLDQVFEDLNKSVDIILDQLINDNEKFNLVASRIFEVLEKRSLFTSSEYLSKKLLTSDDCGCLNTDLEKRLHKYGTMATGQIAPDIEFKEFTYYPDGVSAKQLSGLEADYYLVVFAASWCGYCTESIPKIGEMYSQLKTKNIEVVMVSLDEKPEDFAQFAGPLPFVSTTDYQKWNSKPVSDYQVYATPSYFLLDKDLKILAKLKSVEHLKSWVDYKFSNN